MMPTHGHITEYADPVLRPPSPASSVGTAYGPDQTSFSDSEFQLSRPAFERKCLERIELHLPRKEELDADRDPLITVPGSNGQPVWVGERELDPRVEKMLSEHVMTSLRAEVARLREDEMYEKILLRGSKAALEPQPSTKDIDVLMRSMMGPSMDIGSGPFMGKNLPLLAQKGANVGSGITNGPWNHFGNPTVFERGESVGAGADSSHTLSGTTVGKRSRNGTSRSINNAN